MHTEGVSHWRGEKPIQWSGSQGKFKIEIDPSGIPGEAGSPGIKKGEAHTRSGAGMAEGLLNFLSGVPGLRLVVQKGGHVSGASAASGQPSLGQMSTQPGGRRGRCPGLRTRACLCPVQATPPLPPTPPSVSDSALCWSGVLVWSRSPAILPFLLQPQSPSPSLHGGCFLSGHTRTENTHRIKGRCGQSSEQPGAAPEALPWESPAPPTQRGC